MRVSRASLVALPIVIVAVAIDFTDTGTAARCAGPASCATQGPPAPITLAAGRTNYTVTTGGRVFRSRYRSPEPAGTVGLFPFTGTWYGVEHGHLVIGRDRKALWRSRERMMSRHRLPSWQLGVGVVAAGPRGVAFQHDHELYVAPVEGAERPVARSELPLGWTTDGLYTYSYPRRALLLRSDTGAILKTIARRPHEYVFDTRTAGLYFTDGGVLMGARGARTWRLVSLPALGMSANVLLQTYANLIELQDNHRMTILRADGSVFASTSVRHFNRVSGFLAAAAGDRAVAFTAVTGASSPTESVHVQESVYVLYPGSRAAIPVFHRSSFLTPGQQCGQWASVQWHRSWLLYRDNVGNLAAVDTAHADRTIDLRGIARDVLGHRQWSDARWAR
jgi:hypothetical protein